jgi:tetratricopeptide (TPR) repeat protein
MQTIIEQPFPDSRARSHIQFALLALALGLLAGCASGAKVAPSLAVTPEPSVATAVVVPLGAGREGFMIHEVPGVAAATVRDFEQAVVMMQSGDYRAAGSLLEKVIEQGPGVTAPYINLAIARRHNGQPEQAEESLKTALQLLPAHPVASNEYGLLLRQAGRFSEARTIYEEALSAFPDYSPAHKNLGILCDLYLQDLGCALEHYETYSLAVPKDEQVKLWVADLRGRLERQSPTADLARLDQPGR